jgi:hypothetical protein
MYYRATNNKTNISSIQNIFGEYLFANEEVGDILQKTTLYTPYILNTFVSKVKTDEVENIKKVKIPTANKEEIIITLNKTIKQNEVKPKVEKIKKEKIKFNLQSFFIKKNKIEITTAKNEDTITTPSEILVQSEVKSKTEYNNYLKNNIRNISFLSLIIVLIISIIIFGIFLKTQSAKNTDAYTISENQIPTMFTLEKARELKLTKLDSFSILNYLEYGMDTIEYSDKEVLTKTLNIDIDYVKKYSGNNNIELPIKTYAQIINKSEGKFFMENYKDNLKQLYKCTNTGDQECEDIISKVKNNNLKLTEQIIENSESFFTLISNRCKAIQNEKKTQCDLKIRTTLLTMISNYKDQRVAMNNITTLKNKTEIKNASIVLNKSILDVIENNNRIYSSL